MQYRNGHGSSTPAKISGLQVVRQHRTKKERARLAGAIQRGETELTKLTQAQISRICGVSQQYVSRLQRGNSGNSAPPVVQLAAE
jgi:transcriptional regulator with XRE-family HTH domain